jgi:hypothetical protein
MDDFIRATTELREDMNRQFGAVERRFDAADRALDRARTELDAKMSRGFAWLAGLQVAVLASVLGVLFGP